MLERHDHVSDESNHEILVTRAIEKIIMKAFTYGEVLQIHPYTWNRETNEPEVVRSKWRLFLYHLNITLGFTYYAFLIARALKVCLDDNSKDSEKIYMYFVLVFNSATPILYSNFITRKERLPAYVRSTLAFLRKFQADFVRREGGLKSPKSIKMCEVFMAGAFICFNNNWVLLVTLSMLRYESPEYLSSVLLPLIPKDATYLRFLAISLSSLVQAFIMYMLLSLVFLGTFTLFPTVSPTLVILDELSAKSGGITKSSVRGLGTKLRIFRVLELVTREMNQVFSVAIGGTKALVILVVVFGAFGAIKYHGIVAMGLGFIGANSGSFLLVMFTILYGFNENTTGLLREWKHSLAQTSNSNSGFNVRGGSALLYSKTLESFKPFSLSIGSLYTIDKPMVLTMFKFILESTVNFVLMYR